MDVRHFLKIYNENGEGGVVRMIRSRSFDDINFKRFYQGESKFALVSRLDERIEFSPNETLQLLSSEAYEHAYQYDDGEEMASRKQRLVSENQELPLAVSEMGEIANLCGRYIVSDKNLNEQVAKFEKAILKNANDEIVAETSFENGGMTIKEIYDFCAAVQAVHSEKPFLNFTQISQELLSGFENQGFAENYNELVKILRKVNKFKNIKTRSVQLSFDLSGNIVGGGSNGKQKQ